MKRIILALAAICCAFTFCFSASADGLTGSEVKNLLREEAVRMLQDPAYRVGNDSGENTVNVATDASQPGLSLPGASETDEEIVAEKHEEKALTLMFYICGSDLEAEHGAASNDICEMMCSGFDSSQVNVLVMTGGSIQWLIPTVSADRKSVWEIYPEIFAEQINKINLAGLSQAEITRLVLQSMCAAMKQAERNPAVSMGDPQTLKDFLNFSQTYYPARKYGLILWDHGAGPNQGVCVDNVFDKDLISIPELLDALKNSPFAAAPLEWIGFDACLMGSAEIAAQLAPYAKYMIASEETEPGTGWNYDFLKGIEQDAAGADTGKRIIDIYVDEITEACKTHHVEITATMSCIDLSAMTRVCSAGGELFRALDGKLNADSYVEFAKAREKAMAFGHIGGRKSTFDYDLVDLGDYLDLLPEGEEALRDEMKQALTDAVAYYRSYPEGAEGLSVYYPYFCPAAFPYFREDYQSMSLSDAYSDFIGHAYELQVGTAQADWSGMNTDVPHMSLKDLRTIFMMTLKEDQARLLAEAKLQVFLREGDAYSLAADIPGAGFEEETGSLSAEYVHRALFIANADGSPVSPALSYTMGKDGYYDVEAVLVSHDGEGKELTRDRVLMTLKKAEGDDVNVVSIQKWDDTLESYSPRFGISLSDYDTIEITRQLKTPEEFANGTLLAWDEWKVVKEETLTCSLKEGQKLVLLHDQLDPSVLHASFSIRDYQNHRYLSSLKSFADKPAAQEASLRYDDKDTLVLRNASLSFSEGEKGRSAVLTMDLENLTAQEIMVQVSKVLVDQQETGITADLFGNGPNWGLLQNESQRLILNIPEDVLSGRDELAQIDFVLTIGFEDASTKEIPVTVLMNIQ